ncbi:hypothetical protein [Thiorhodococcus minor]|uniref:Uncharacterized protein n=1 Tax=Thiorhodococcus minor TaxID=57489 RepID=A0A6M0K6A5_9GAMM|nr:hypothetical protein [Thiorhodococcus minor]NEV64841.1 hypothetical protein [Thiorhodococcus minor]
MHAQPSSAKLRKKLNLKRYLDELTALIGRPVHADELGSLEQAASIREASQKFHAQATQACEIPFSERCSERFKGFVQRLHGANHSSVYVWTPRTIDCGILLVPSLAAVKFTFDFAVNEEGIFVFLTSDLEDRLLLDFSVSPKGEQVMKVETQGANWVSVTY